MYKYMAVASTGFLSAAAQGQEAGGAWPNEDMADKWSPQEAVFLQLTAFVIRSHCINCSTDCP